MLNNENTADLVKKELESDIYILEMINEGLINTSALARKLHPIISKQNPKATIESITVAISRYSMKQKQTKISTKMRTAIANTQLYAKNDVVHMTFKRNAFVASTISKISGKVKWEDDEIFFVGQGSGEIGIVIDKKNKKLLENCKDYLIESTSNLAILSLKEAFEKEARETPGLYAYFIGQVARNGVNLVEILSTLSQLTFVIRESDLTKTYEILNQKIKYFRK